MKTLVILLLMTMIIMGTVACATVMHSQSPFPLPTETSKMEPTFEILTVPDSELPFKANMNTSTEIFLPGEEVRYGISITDLSSGTISIDPFPPAGQVKLVGQDKAIYSWPAGDRTKDINPGPFYHNMGSWDQKDSNGNQVSPGWYVLSYQYIITDQNTSKRYSKNLISRFRIVSSDSAMTKTLEVNQSVTTNDIKVTLERVEMNAVGGIVSIFTIPPGYSLPKDRPPEQLSESLGTKSKIEYRIDGGVSTQPKNIEDEFNESGIITKWQIDPIPVNAKELTLSISRLGEWNGPWEFKIKLN
jgi:hypothetical protein